MKEKTIAKFKYENNTFKLLEITYENDYINPLCGTTLDRYEYLIVKNRRRLTWTKWEGTARQKFANIIAGELLQTKITF